MNDSEAIPTSDNGHRGNSRVTMTKTFHEDSPAESSLRSVPENHLAISNLSLDEVFDVNHVKSCIRQPSFDENGKGKFSEPEMTFLRNLLPPSDSPSIVRRHSTSMLNMSDFSSMLEIPSRRGASPKPGLEGALRAKYHWALVRQYICCSFAIRGDKRKPWVQLAGHKDHFQVCDDVGTVRKKKFPEEEYCLRELMEDVLKPFVPLYLGYTNIDGVDYIEMRDLLTGFDRDVSVMDCKMGVRTYLESELEKNAKLRPDMYQRMIDLDPNAPTPEEHAHKAVTKPRYMQWRETLSSSATMGFRIEGIKKADGFSSRDFKFTKSRSDVLATLAKFTDRNVETIQLYVHRLRDLRRALSSSEFFSRHELIGTSLLFIHDKNGLAGVWMIDFAKSVPLPTHIKVDHNSPWIEGNHEDGYLIGLNNLISCLEELLPKNGRVSS